MLPQRLKTLGRERTSTDPEHSIRLLASLAGVLADLGLVEEALDACRAITVLRDGLASEGHPMVAPWVMRPIES